MRFYHLHAEVWLQTPIEQVFTFFADARNLGILTPPWLKFQILTPMPTEMKAGCLIDYRIRLHALPLRWRSKITLWDPPRRFVDEQVRGPYRAWIHDHGFSEQNGYTQVIDHVRYAVWGGALVERLFVRKDLERIFAFRRAKLLSLFCPQELAGKGGIDRQHV